jgi:hypothetical protein
MSLLPLNRGDIDRSVTFGASAFFTIIDADKKYQKGSKPEYFVVKLPELLKLSTWKPTYGMY